MATRLQAPYTYMCDVPESAAHCNRLCGKRATTPNQSNLSLTGGDLLEKCSLRPLCQEGVNGHHYSVIQ